MPQQTQTQNTQAPPLQNKKKNSVSFDLNPGCPIWTPGQQHANLFATNVCSTGRASWQTVRANI